ncbi:MAG: ABC transporter permease DevC [Snowella sp.]|nr:ABC transporter permease DevC [Snowella sp.]
MKIPLSWHQLTHERMRLAVAIAGIAFADILMFMQLGFKNALFDSAVRLPKSLKGDIFLVSSQTDTFISPKNFSARRLYEVMGINGIQNINPMYMNVSVWKNPDTKATRQIFVIGFNPVHNVLDLPGIADNLDLTKQPDVVLFDQRSRAEFGPIKQDFLAGKTVTTEVANRNITVGGLFTLGSSFGADGFIVTSDLNFFRLFPDRQKGLINVGVIQLEPGANLNQVYQEVKNKLSRGDDKLFTKAEQNEYERN